jgi:hypothetical protein
LNKLSALAAAYYFLQSASLASRGGSHGKLRRVKCGGYLESKVAEYKEAQS